MNLEDLTSELHPYLELGLNFENLVLKRQGKGICLPCLARQGGGRGGGRGQKVFKFLNIIALNMVHKSLYSLLQLENWI